ncbi:MULTISPECIES: SpoIIE family protein phosphatase [unclassified Caballeronia]|jgi:sigma-B regulation protein RsbU (phosphoserine phosphatase)|uniref:SpoIIE family protein phosphatase n=1 Tax=unclassified Caballeronia TaxID=2646786 RepID=UPI0020282E27|nr:MULTISPECIES: SpoIIE family protein phosphatase [unclassified Caballeronia]
MSDLTAALFARYNRVMRIALVGVLVVACALVYLQYRMTLQAQTSGVSQRMQEQAIALDALVRSSTDAVNAMRIQGETWLRLHPQGAPDTALLDALRPGREPDSIQLDALPAPWTPADAGNLTGLVGPRTRALDRELKMALSLNGPFKTIMANLPGATWVYYTSARRFINIYPWVASKDYFYADSLRKQEFFTEVQRAPGPERSVFWTPVYVDEAGKGLMVTASAGVFDGSAFRGSVSLDLTLGWLNQFVRTWPPGLGRMFIVNDRGQLLADPELVHAGAQEVRMAADAFPPALRRDVERVLRDADGRLTIFDDYYIEAVGIGHAPFRLVLLLPRWNLQRVALETGVPSVLVLVLSLTLMLMIASRMTYNDAILPAQKLVRYIQDEDRGSVKSIPDIPQAWRPWFLTIQNVFNAHTKLVSIQQELDVARRMQQSIVPTRFPSRPDLQMFARMVPAREVGGDFYDYFWLSDQKIGVVIADVSGKGVPAALFMAVARTLLRAIAPSAASPGACLALANDLLAQDNEATMFVTLFYGILDTATGELEYANGGHNPPYVIAPDGSISQLPGTGGMALGVIEGTPFAEGHMRLDAGTTLLLYTDGVTEAFNPADEEYGELRLAQHLADAKGVEVEVLLKRLFDSVHRFADGAPQSDDITCLAIHYGASGPTTS